MLIMIIIMFLQSKKHNNPYMEPMQPMQPMQSMQPMPYSPYMQPMR